MLSAFTVAGLITFFYAEGRLKDIFACKLFTVSNQAIIES